MFPDLSLSYRSNTPFHVLMYCQSCWNSLMSIVPLPSWSNNPMRNKRKVKKKRQSRKNDQWLCTCCTSLVFYYLHTWLDFGQKFSGYGMVCTSRWLMTVIQLTAGCSQHNISIYAMRQAEAFKNEAVEAINYLTISCRERMMQFSTNWRQSLIWRMPRMWSCYCLESSVYGTKFLLQPLPGWCLPTCMQLQNWSHSPISILDGNYMCWWTSSTASNMWLYC